jgi:hypothetical protein
MRLQDEPFNESGGSASPVQCGSRKTKESLVAEIRIESTSSELVPGQTSRISIVVVLAKALKVRGLHATFHGAEETKATYTTYNAATKSTQTQTAVECVDIVKTDYVLSGREQKGFLGNMADGLATIVGSGDHDVLEPGEYPFEIEVQVPRDARASFGGSKCRVFYELSVFIDIPLWRDVKALKSFQVTAAPDTQSVKHDCVRTRYPEDQDRGLFDALLSPDVKVEAALADGALCEGDTIEGMFVVDTMKPLQYRSIRARLIAIECTSAHGHTDRHVHQGDAIEIAAEGVIEGKYSKEYKLPVLSPGEKPDRGKLFSIDCFVQIELDVPWAKDPKMRVPVTLL